MRHLSTRESFELCEFRAIFGTRRTRRNCKMNAAVLDTTVDSLTIGFGGQNHQVEIKVNDQQEPKQVNVPGGLLKKKNLKPGDVVSVRVKEGVNWSEWKSFTVSPSRSPLPAPAASVELALEDTALAVVGFPAISDASQYQVDLFPFDGTSEEWVTVSDSLASNGVRKKNLRQDIKYSFRYRGLGKDGWSEFSSASLPTQAPEKSQFIAQAITSRLVKPDGTLVDAKIALSGKAVLVLHSAHWCPPCRQFTPKLAEFYKSMRALGKPIEVVFVSSDHDEKSFSEYFGQHMPWLAVPYTDARREQIAMEHQVRGIPSLLVLSGNSGKVVDADGRQRSLVPATVDYWLSLI